jgi:pimeloyl-ACP methyl ester carboxylesterase
MQIRRVGDISFVCGSWPLDDNKSTIVFIHGAGGSNYLWRSQVNALADRVNTVALDLPGHGKSDGEGCQNVAAYAASVTAFVEAIEAPRPIPCGLSMGGAITLQLLIDNPQRFPAAVLISTGARLKVLPAIFEAIQTDYPGFLEMLDRFAFAPTTARDVRRAFIEDSAACAPEITYGDFMACNGFDVTGQLSGIDVPVLVMTAEEDRLTPVKYGEYLEKNLDRAARCHIREAGHIAPVEQPNAVNRAIREFFSML